MVIDCLAEFQREGGAVLLVTHDGGAAAAGQARACSCATADWQWKPQLMPVVRITREAVAAATRIAECPTLFLREADCHADALPRCDEAALQGPG